MIRQMFERIAQLPLPVLMLLGGTVLLTLALVLLMYTRWGRYRPLRKCVVLSVLAHALIVMWLWVFEIVEPPAQRSAAMRITEVATSADTESQPDESKPLAPWEQPPHEAAQINEVYALARWQPAQRVGLNRRRPAGEAVPLPQASLRVPLAAAESETPDGPPAAEESHPQATPVAVSERIKARAAQRRQPLQRLPEAKVHLPRQEQPAFPPSPVSPQREATQSPLLNHTPAASRAAASRVEGGLPRLANSDEDLAKSNSPLSPEDIRQAMRRADGAEAVTEANVRRPRRSTTDVDTPSRRGSAPQPDTRVDTDNAPSAPSSGTGPRRRQDHAVPELYRARVAPQRAQIIAQRGGSAETEAAVSAALRWLAASQHRDGRWDASRHGAGTERHVDGQDRRSAGTRADTGVTGLALLAFLGAGQTHRYGAYRSNVQAALDFLRRIQGQDGNLCGKAQVYAAMYCHGMATLALGEAYGMTGDESLRKPLERAIEYTLATQASTGGWRYRSTDLRGDTSQLGWHLMSIKSAELAGLEVPWSCRQNMVRFLGSVTSGQHGGLASYRSGDAVSRTMTAEALVCRQLLGMTRGNPAADEAGRYILEEPPGASRVNLYYWYYATLAAYQLQGDYWQRWNKALKRQLLARQKRDGSWSPDTKWGGYGGKVYSTAMAALCLEVYYRYLPIFKKATE